MLNVSDPGQPPFLLGKLYPHGRWFYFPIVFIIKSTLGFLALLVLTLISGSWRTRDRPLKFLYLVVPPVVVLVIAMQSGLNIGYRHIRRSYRSLHFDQRRRRGTVGWCSRLEIRDCGASPGARCLLLAFVSELSCLLERSLGRSNANLPLPD